MPVDPEKQRAARRARTQREIAEGKIAIVDWDTWPREAPPGMLGTAEIVTNGGERILIDADLYDELNRHTWYISLHGYAMTHILGRGVAMHRVILGLRTGDKRVADHINHNRLDNRRENLRACTRDGNNRNIQGRRHRISRYKGVSPNKKRWMAQITFQRQVHHLGTFDTQEEAALAYNAAARRLHGEFAHLNDVS